MASSYNSPSPSQDDGAAYTWILEHILSYPSTYEISLRNMYTLNSSPQGYMLPHQASRPSTAQSTSRSSLRCSPLAADFHDDQRLHRDSNAQAASAVQLRANLMSQISQLPTQPCSLPPRFITAFVRRCFAEQLEQVDFPHALTALDYLRDLEARRRKELGDALRSVGIDQANFGPEGLENIRNTDHDTLDWVKSMVDKERKVQALYTQIYIGLRRWMLINEMSLLPFNKSNSLALLNTLYPPSVTVQPTQQLTPAILHQQRDGYFRYIKAVEKNGRAVLENVIMHGRRIERNDATGWPCIRETLDLYLRAANGMIDECSSVQSEVRVLAEQQQHQAPKSNNNSDHDVSSKASRASTRSTKFDSGVSFNTTDQSSVSSTTSKSAEKLPPAHQFTAPPAKSGGSTLERIARELRKFRSDKKQKQHEHQQQQTSNLQPPPPSSSHSNERANSPLPRNKLQKQQQEAMKKARSTTALSDLKTRNRSFVRPSERNRTDMPDGFDISEEARLNAIALARAAASPSSRSMRSTPHEL